MNAMVMDLLVVYKHFQTNIFVSGLSMNIKYYKFQNFVITEACGRWIKKL